MQSELLTDPKQINKDIRLLQRALRWESITPEVEAIVVERLIAILGKQTVDAITNDGGIFSDEDKADKNAIAAARALVAMMAQRQKDEHFRERNANPRLPNQTTVNVGVKIESDERRNRIAAIAERLGASDVPRSTTEATTDECSQRVIRSRGVPAGNRESVDG